MGGCITKQLKVVLDEKADLSFSSDGSSDSVSVHSPAGLTDCESELFRSRLSVMRQFYSWNDIPIEFFIDGFVEAELADHAVAA